MQYILPDHELGIILGAEGMVNTDELRLEQVFSNLLGNEAKYSEKRSKILVSTEVLPDSTVRIGVTDCMKAISAENLEAIFDKFYRTDDVLQSHSGLGMGLFVSSKIMTVHGGKIWVETKCVKAQLSSLPFH